MRPTIHTRIALALLALATVAATGCNDGSPSVERTFSGVARAQTAGQGGPDVEPRAPLQCYKAARGELRLADRTSYLLCNGAPSIAPVQCFEAARARTRLIDWQIVNLCRCTSSVAPVGCFEEGKDETGVTDDAVVGRCSARASQQLRSNCAPLTPPAPPE
jgi:hypothetical protein